MTSTIPAPVRQIDFIPLIYGSVAFSLGKTEDGTTHRWTIYVRGVEGRDLSSVIAKVVFKLHPTCNSPIVECNQYPFETTQPGWGEFPAVIEVTFRDDKLPAVAFTHQLRLHHVGAQVGQINKPVVHETYEEIVFRNPNSDFNERLQALQFAPCPSHPLSAYWKSFSDDADLKAIQKAHAFVKSQLEIVVNEYGKLDAELTKVLASKTLASQATKDIDLSKTEEGKSTSSQQADSNQNGESAVSTGESPEAKRIKLEPNT
jgi:YEATS domain-containing protein 4